MDQEDKKLKDLKVSDVKKMYVRYVLFVSAAVFLMVIGFLIWALTM